MRLDKHPILMQGHNVMQAIEVCGCSVELTTAVTMAGALMDEVEKLVDRLKQLETLGTIFLYNDGQQNITSIRGAEAGLPHLEIVTKGETASWKHTIHTEEI